MTRVGAVAAMVIAALVVFAPKPAQSQGATPAAADATALYAQLSQTTLDPRQVYIVHGAKIERGGAKFFFDRGFVALFAPVGGEVTGAVFSGEGEVLLIPPSPVEKRNLDQFIGAPILEEHFVSALMRFTDRTAQEILAQARRPGPDDPKAPSGFLEYWDTVARRFDPAYAGPILA